MLKKRKDLPSKLNSMIKLLKKLKERISGLKDSKRILCLNSIKIEEILRKKWTIDSIIKMKLLEIFSILLALFKKLLKQLATNSDNEDYISVNFK